MPGITYLPVPSMVTASLSLRCASAGVTIVEIPALVLLAIWFVLQFVPALGQVAAPEPGGGEGIAYFAHVGGFIFGLATVKLLTRRGRDREPDPALPA